MDDNNAITVSIGDRIQVEQDRATVLYVGPIEGSLGEWIGVQWDDPKRGKHSGEKNGVSYFTTTIPKSGSFLRVKKVETGLNFLTALREKYVTQNQDSEDMLLKLGANDVEVETVGWQKVASKQSKLESLQEVSLTNAKISGAGSEVSEIAQQVPNIRDLDLSSNLLSDWEQVALIVGNLPNLSILRLNGNYFKYNVKFGDSLNALSNLKTLSLIRTKISWTQVLSIAPYLQKLENLQLGFNNIQKLSNPGAFFPSLKLLSLEENNIKDWGQINKLAGIPNLQVLDLTRNRIQEIIIPSSQPGGMFEHLEKLILTGNRIAEWPSIDELNKLPALTDLRLMYNPVLAKHRDSDVIRMQVIARIERLTSFNGTVLAIAGVNKALRNERADSEVYYLQSCAVEYFQQRLTKEKLKQLHPRFEELALFYNFDNVDQDTTNNVAMAHNSSLLKNRLLEIKCEIVKTGQVETLKILPTLTLRQIKNLIRRTFNLSPDVEMEVYRVAKASDSDEYLRMFLDNDLREIGYFNLQKEDSLSVELFN